MNDEEIKAETLRLYDELSQDEETRKNQLDIRDRIIELNDSFFHYLAHHIPIYNSSVGYEDIYQSVLCNFLRCWWWYRFYKKYPKTESLAFSSFYQLRLKDMVTQELSTISKSTRRQLLMKLGNQVGKHWGQVTYDDLNNPNVNLPVEQIQALQCVLTPEHEYVNIEDVDYGLQGEIHGTPRELQKYYKTEYDDVKSMLIHEMLVMEAPLSDRKLNELSTIYTIPFYEIKSEYTEALKELYGILHDSLEE